MFNIVDLKSVCDIQSGGTPSRNENSFYNGNVKWAKISDLEKAGDGFIYDTEEYISESGLKDIRNRIFEVDTLFFAMYGSVGKTAITKDKMSCNQAILGITVNNTNLIDLKYLKYYFELTKEKLINSARGVALKNLSAGLIKELKIPLPPLETQKHIAQILDDAAALRDKTRQLIKEYDALAQSIFLDMFGDTWTNPKNWKICNVEDVAKKEKYSIKAGPFGSALKKEFYSQSGYKIYGQEQVIKDDFDYGDYYINDALFQNFKNCEISSGDILISLVGTFGKIAIVPRIFEKGIINPRLMKISPDPNIIESVFFKKILQSDGVKMQLEFQSRGQTMGVLNLAIIRKIKIPVPPIDLQNQFIEKIALIEHQKELAKQELKESEDLFNCLLQKAFKGELV